MCDRWLLRVAVFLALSAALSRASSAQQDDSVRHAGAEPMALGQNELNAEVAEAAEAPAEPYDAVPKRESFLVWFLGSLGWRYTLMLPAVTLLSFVLLCLVMIYGRGWAAGAAAVLLVPMPFFVGLMGTIDGLIQSYMVIASMDVTPRPDAIAAGISSGLVSSLAGICLMAPNYCLAVIGLFVRSLRDDRGTR